jgi:hypothetical protein
MRDPVTGRAFGGADLSAVRQLPATIAGHAAYVMPSASGICLWVEQFGGGCGTPLTSSFPVLFSAFDPAVPGPVGTTAYGIAQDGVESITLTVNGSPVTVPVRGNAFEFSGGSSVTPDDITNVTANFDDGRSVTLK